MKRIVEAIEEYLFINPEGSVREIRDYLNNHYKNGFSSYEVSGNLRSNDCFECVGTRKILATGGFGRSEVTVWRLKQR